MTNRNMQTNTPGRIGIFRRIAVERYMRPLQLDLPVLMPPCSVAAGIMGFALLLAAIAALFGL